MGTETAAALPAVTKEQERALVREGAVKWSKAEVLALRDLCCPKDATPNEILAFWYVCKRTGLDPFARQIYLVRYVKGEGEEGTGRCTIQVGIDGFRQVSMEAPGFAGIEEPKFEGEGESEGGDGKVKHPLIARVTVFRIINGERAGFVGVARWTEYAKYIKDKETGKKRLRAMWAAMPYNMLAKCAEAQAHRKSAPMRLSGVYAPEEVGTVIDVVGTPVGVPVEQPRALAAPANSGGSSEKPNKRLWNLLMNQVGGNSEEAANQLEKLTAFRGSKGPVKGVRDYTKLSDAWANATLKKLDA